jgi:ketosteroid isomerase-like protein
MNAAIHPAQLAGRRSIDCVRRKDKAGWLALYADDAIVQDPVGVSPLDPAGNGHRGKEAIGRFWDMVIAPGNLEFTLHASHPCADECANVATITNTMPGGVKIRTDLVIVYRVNEAGLIVSLKAYWEYAKVEEQLNAALANAGTAPKV